MESAEDDFDRSKSLMSHLRQLSGFLYVPGVKSTTNFPIAIITTTPKAVKPLIDLDRVVSYIAKNEPVPVAVSGSASARIDEEYIPSVVAERMPERLEKYKETRDNFSNRILSYLIASASSGITASVVAYINDADIKQTALAGLGVYLIASLASKSALYLSHSRLVRKIQDYTESLMQARLQEAYETEVVADDQINKLMGKLPHK